MCDGHFNPAKENGVDPEARELMKDLPSNYGPNIHAKPNAYVYVDRFGRLAILPERGGWLGVCPKDVMGDFAPFSD